MTLATDTPSYMWTKCTEKFPEESKALSAEKAVLYLQRAAAKASQLQMKPVDVNQPDDATLLLVHLHPHAPTPADGYGWMDGETVRSVTVGCDSLEIRQRTQGFASSASSTSHGTLRFRLAGSSLMLVQWVTSPSTSIPVDLARAAVTPRTASARRGVSDVSRSAVVMPLSGVNADSTLKDAAEDDDVDILSARDIAATRYARNHALVEEIFSIYPTSAIVAPPRYSKVTPENYAARMDALRAQKAAEEAEINRSRNVHLKSVAEYIAARDLVWTAFQDLKTAEDSKAIDANTKRLKLSVVPRKNVVQVTL